MLIYVFSEFYLIEPQSQDFVQMYVARLWENPLNCSWNNSSCQNNSSRVSARFYVVVKKSFTVASLSVAPLGLSVRVSKNKCVCYFCSLFERSSLRFATTSILCFLHPMTYGATDFCER